MKMNYIYIPYPQTENSVFSPDKKILIFFLLKKGQIIKVFLRPKYNQNK
jgi:hypothetical protein